VEASALLPSASPPSGLFSNDARTLGKVGTADVEAFRELAMAVAEQVDPEDLADRHGSCRDPAEDCLEPLLRGLALDLFRRPLRPDERARYGSLHGLAVAETGDFDLGTRLVVEAMLQSPHFLYRIEAEPGPGDAVREVDGYALASRLSFLFWGRGPDPLLRDLAETGELARPDVLAAQVDRMIADPRAESVFLAFVDDWLRLQDLDRVAFDPEVYGPVGDELRRAIRAEPEALFAELWRDGLPWSTMLTTREAVLRPELAVIYGLDPADSGAGPTRYDLGGLPERGGILTQAAVIGVQGQVTRAQEEAEPSLVHRGKFLLEALFCGTIPPPPNDVANDPSFLASSIGTERGAAEERAANARCVVCHEAIDPLGLALLPFDNLGRRRSTDAQGLPVDGSGVFAHPFRDETLAFSGIRELSDHLATDATVQACLVRQLTQYAWGDPSPTRNACLLAELSASLPEAPSFPEVLRAIALHPSYRRIAP
ncbi:MAG TPA: DUF1592 domain-containing protein, partial [Polyangiaceae bacterium LLY-WYZ-14_1]|nr:DUF1592 domain-containing protein [Polyangiaceae bacterium LLY-WYZ-14_1]